MMTFKEGRSDPREPAAGSSGGLALLPPPQDCARFRSLMDASEERAWEILGARPEAPGCWLSRRQISAKDWVLLIKCFELGLGGEETAQVSRLALATVFRALRTIRFALASLDAAWRDAVLARDQDDAGLPGVLGVATLGDRLRVDLTPASVWRLAPGQTLPAFHRAGFVYTGPHAGYEALCWHARFPGPAYRPARGGHVFLRFLEGRLARHFGVPMEAFPLYIKENEFRFNHRAGGLFEAVAAALAAPVPSRR